jgi:predicted transposase/invertase (TIGR01784 family)
MAKLQHDKLFKELLQLFFEDFLRAFFPEIHAKLDFSQFGPSNFLANEHILDHGKKRKIIMDLVARVKEKGAHDYVIVFIENQSYREKDFAERVFSYFAAVYLKYRRPVVPIVVFTDDAKWTLTPAITDFSIGFGAYNFLHFHYLSVKLKNLDFRNYLRTQNPVAVALAAKMGYQKHELPKLKIDILRTLVQMRLPVNAMETLAKFVDTYIDIEKDPKTNKEMLSLLGSEDNKEVKMLLTMWEKRGLKAGREEGLEEGREEGLEKGLEKGREKGREEGKFEVAKKLLERGMSFEDIRIITGLSNARINGLKKKKTRK